MATLVDAQTIRRCAPTTTYAPTYQPTYTPTYQTYQAPYYPPTYYYQPYALPVELTRDYYFESNSYSRDKLLADAVAGKVALLMLSQQQKQQPQQQREEPVRKNPAPVYDPGPPMPPAPARGQATSVAPELLKIVEAKCIKCHGQTKPGGGLDLTDLATLPSGPRWHMFGLVNSKEMPKALPELSDAEVVIFYEFAKLAPTGKTAGR